MAPPLPNEEQPASSEPVESGAADIELDLGTTIEIPRYVVHDHEGLYTREVMPLPPVPSRPLHLCPYCDYNLTGLTTYRCPECGQPFTISEARQRAMELSPDFRYLRWSARLGRFGGFFGFLLLVAAAVLPNAIAGGCANYPAITVTGAGLLSWGFLMVLILSACLVKSFIDASWWQLLLAVGLLASAVTAMLCFL